MKFQRIIIGASALFLLLAEGAAAQTMQDRVRRDLTTDVPRGDPEMEAAFAKARATLDEFLAALASPPPNTRAYAVKIPITDPGNRNVEFFWLVDLQREGDRFKGRINNTPRSVRNVRNGQVMSFARAEIHDWMYFDDANRRMMGNFTACALLSREKPEDAAQMKRTYGMVCD